MRYQYKVITYPISESESFNEELETAMEDGFTINSASDDIETVAGTDDTWLVAKLQKFVK